MGKVLNMTYASSLTDLCEVNSSFDTGVLRIAYAGDNKNNTSISKETFEKCMKTMYNCPIVCHYDRETDSLGGHDVEVVRDEDGSLRLVNLTVPVGCIPESAKQWWTDVEEEDGTIHEYLCSEVLLWKRQEAYKKIKADGITAHSMEISVKDGEMIDGVYHIYDFEFTAFALIGVKPCFESSALETFSKSDFKQQLTEMMQDLKDHYYSVNTSYEVDDTHPQNYTTEGGEKVLEDKMNECTSYNEEPETEAIAETEPANDVAYEAADEPAKDEPVEASNDAEFALNGNVVSELIRVLGTVKVQHECGEYDKYWYVDCDLDKNEVYCTDMEDWLLYGFAFSVDGDSITIDFESKKRKKYAIEDFDGGEQPAPMYEAFSEMERKALAYDELEAKYQSASDTIASMEQELGDLRRFKADTELAISNEEKETVFSHFEDLVGVEAFENLREHKADYTADELEEKCYAIRGKHGTVAKFSLEESVPKLKVDKVEKSDEPYGGLFVKYGYEA